MPLEMNTMQEERAVAGTIPPAWREFQALSVPGLLKLRELDPTGGSALLRRIMKAYEESATRLVRQLVQGLQAGDGPAIRQAAHTLKSSSASIGAVKFSEVCADIEAMVRSGVLPHPSRSSDQVVQLFELVLREVRSLVEP